VQSGARTTNVEAWLLLLFGSKLAGLRPAALLTFSTSPTQNRFDGGVPAPPPSGDRRPFDDQG
jgi:hypothetical protein